MDDPVDPISYQESGAYKVSPVSPTYCIQMTVSWHSDGQRTLRQLTARSTTYSFTKCAMDRPGTCNSTATLSQIKFAWTA